MALAEILPLRPAVLGPVLLLVGYLIYKAFFSGPKLPKLPIVGAKEGDWFPLWQARLRNAVDFKAAVIKAEADFRGQTVLLPVLGGGGNDRVMLPRSEAQFVTDQPDSVLSMHVEVVDSLQFNYTVIDSNLVHNPVHHHLITTTLTNQIGNLVPDVSDETAQSVGETWGNDTTAWKEATLYSDMASVISRVTNRVFVGAPKCRDPNLLRVSLRYASQLPIIGQILKATWEPIRPVAAFFLTIPLRITMRNWTAVLRDEIETRMAVYNARQRDPEKKSAEPEPNDFLQWSIHQAMASGDPYMWKTSTLAARILLVNFAAIHTSTMSITGAILDLVASKQEYIDELREEIESVLAEHGGEWNKRALAKMEKLDSVMRESARLNSFVTIGLPRRVVAKDGITTPSGVKLPYNSTVIVPSYTVLHDDERYPDAEEFKPFRFAEQRSDETVGYVKRAGKQFATTSTDFLTFGHGRYACPGRFFAANELKLILGHVVMNYDFEVTGKGSRPRNKWYGMVRIPPMEAKIRIRKRVR
ncbi:cytochrome P450 [Podospora aff. communis PSN243]|uniref:Cytochrome P450 n=1 Tax=Podospora aff. communis PSN243 TaxID=3040156 RepID=A0AAV9G8Y2_9PEZI|nr:cytochrome P450 [Podospora aff. communis PSN243]